MRIAIDVWELQGKALTGISRFLQGFLRYAAGRHG